MDVEADVGFYLRLQYRINDKLIFSKVREMLVGSLNLCMLCSRKPLT
jgi:hypothetical protein